MLTAGTEISDGEAKDHVAGGDAARRGAAETPFDRLSRL
jgi:hypothetical protein